MVTKKDIQSYFSEDDEIKTGGGKTYFRVTEILDDKIRIQPTESRTASRLCYQKLSATIENIEDVDPKSITKSVGAVLKDNGLRDTTNETYLYGMALESWQRKGVIGQKQFQNEFEEELTKSKKRNSLDRKARLRKAGKIPKKIKVSRIEFYRNPDVVVEVLERAGKYCEQCKFEAPFTRAKDGTPYLEVHHKKQLAHGGEDTVKNAIALCPNCHRKQHYG